MFLKFGAALNQHLHGSELTQSKQMASCPRAIAPIPKPSRKAEDTGAEDGQPPAKERKGAERRAAEDAAMGSGDEPAATPRGGGRRSGAKRGGKGGSNLDGKSMQLVL